MCFRTANKNFLTPSNTYKQCEKSLLPTEINMKRSHLRGFEQKEFSFLRKKLQSVLLILLQSVLLILLQSVLNCTDFAHICSLFLSGNDSFIKTHDDIQENKFNKLLKERQPRQDPEEVIFNYSNISLSYAEKSLLVKDNLSHESLQVESLQVSSKNTNLMIQKSDKRNSVVIIDKHVYIKHSEPLLSGKAKF